MDIRDRVALVTGAGYGIGRGIALRLAAAGAHVVVNDVHEEHGRETVGMIESAGGKAAFVHADVTLDGAIQRAITVAEGTFGGLDILVNNAGTYYDPPFYPVAEARDWRRILEVFLTAYMDVMQRAIEAMKRRGGGAVVNIASSAGVGFKADNDWPDYANCICPGWVATENVRAYLSTWSEERKQQQDVPAGGPDAMLQPTDIGDAVVQFVRDESRCGRILLYYEPGKKRLIPTDLDLFELSEEA